MAGKIHKHSYIDASACQLGFQASSGQPYTTPSRLTPTHAELSVASLLGIYTKNHTQWFQFPLVSIYNCITLPSTAAFPAPNLVPKCCNLIVLSEKGIRENRRDGLFGVFLGGEKPLLSCIRRQRALVILVLLPRISRHASS